MKEVEVPMNNRWYLRMQDETFGPESMIRLLEWARQGRVQPGQEISSDGVTWTPVTEVPFLDMRWSIDIGDGYPRGPFNKMAAQTLLSSGRLPSGSHLVEVRPPFEKPSSQQPVRDEYACRDQDPPVPAALELQEGGHNMKRKALFVGVNEYVDPKIQNLRYAISDAAMLFAQFKAIGFEADELMPNPTRSEVEEKIARMTEDMEGEGDVFLFYFAGHGFVAPGDDERLFCRDDFYRKLQYHSAGLSFAMLRDTTRLGGLNRIFILDACRSNAFTGERGNGRPRDLAPISALMGAPDVGTARRVGGHAIWRSCSSGQCAMELEQFEHGVFSLAIDTVMTECIRTGRELTFDKPFMRLVVDKMQSFAQDGEQLPEDQYSGNWPGMILIPGRKTATTLPKSTALVLCPVCGFRNREEQTFRCRVCGRDYLCTTHFDKQERCCEDCAAAKRREREAAECRAREDAERRAREIREASLRNGTCLETGVCRTITLPGGAEMEMVYCPPGEFVMGSPADEEGRFDHETQHRVRLTKGFWLGKYPVTQGQWQSVMGNNPSHFKGDDLPVEFVSWDDCQIFVKKVNAAQGCGARLPTEAEWEYACRAGTTTVYFWGNALNGDKANCNGNYPCGTKTKGAYLEKVTPVGRYAPNSWGFFDMHGNVWEWCADWCGDYSGDAVDPKGPSSGSNRVLRGGSWYTYARSCRSADRYGQGPGYRNIDCGFRFCCSAGQCENGYGNAEGMPKTTQTGAYGSWRLFKYLSGGGLTPWCRSVYSAQEEFERGEDFYYGRNGVDQDEMEAIKWYRKAAEHGYADAQFRLGMIYEERSV